MDQNEYPRPGESAGFYSKDKTWGIVIIVLSVLGICGGIALGGLGGIVGAVGATGAATASGNGAADARNAAAAAGVGGGLLMVMGLFTVVASVLQLIGGVGIMKSLRWGFLLTGGFAALNVIVSLFRLPTSIVGILISGVILYYCWSRLSGKEGPTPA